MGFLKVFFLIGFAMLLMLADVSAEVYDDEGKIITEEEIEREMWSAYRASCCVGGVLISLPVIGGGLLITACAMDSEWGGRDIELALLGVGGIAAGVGVIAGSYYAGKAFDRRAAIGTIKEKRRKQKQGLLNLEKEQFFLAHPRLQMKPNRLHHRRGESDVVVPLIAVGF